jgi:hypothetical protein
VDAMRRPPGARAECLIRAQYNRRLAHSKAQRYLWTAMRAAQPLGRLTFALARTPARPPRQRTVTVTAKQVTFQQARRPGGPRPPVAVAVLYAQEGAPPPGEEAVAGRLLTSLPVRDCASASAVGSGPLGDGPLFPGAPARLSDRAVTATDGAAVAECQSDLSHYCVAYPSHHHGGTSVSRGLG